MSIDTYKTSNASLDSSPGNNQFDLVDRIGIKLKECVNNIKTQILIHEIHETEDNQLFDVNSNEEEETKDDWTIDTSDDYNLKVPSFIRLFVIRRIISKRTITSAKKNNPQSTNTFDPQMIDNLVNVFNDNVQIQTIAHQILSRLINDGIKKYMSMWYNEKDQANIIKMIFNKIILVKFENEYKQLMKYSGNGYRNYNCNDIDYFQNVVFNSEDLMSQIFQYLHYGYSFDWELIRCGLVNSHWLYHS